MSGEELMEIRLMIYEKIIKIIESRFDIMDYAESEELGDALDFVVEMLKSQSILDTRQRERQLEIEYQHGYDKGWEEGRKALEQQPCEDVIKRDWLSTFNTESYIACFTAVQELKKRLEGDTDGTI